MERDLDYEEELRAQARFDQQLERKLGEHPDCRDPDHPGCPACNEEEE